MTLSRVECAPISALGTVSPRRRALRRSAPLNACGIARFRKLAPYGVANIGWMGLSAMASGRLLPNFFDKCDG